MNYADFVVSIQKNTGVSDWEETEDIIDAVLEALSDYIDWSDFLHLTAQLPEEIQDRVLGWESIGWGKSRSTLNDFLEAISDRVSADPEICLDYARAVLRAIANSVADTEMDELRARLPRSFQPMFETELEYRRKAG